MGIDDELKEFGLYKDYNKYDRRSYYKAYYQAHREQKLKRAHEYYLANKEKILAQQKAHNQRVREEIERAKKAKAET